jgi:hypothetical protein
MEEHGTRASTVASVVARKFAHWAADEQLKRVTAWLYGNNLGGVVNRLEDAMRPKTLVEQGAADSFTARGAIQDWFATIPTYGISGRSSSCGSQPSR